MARVNPVSVREEFEFLQRKFRQLRRSEAMPPAAQALFKSMLSLMQLLIAVLLEKHTRKTPVNSSLSSAQVQAEDTALRPGAKGKGPQAKRADGEQVQVVTETRVSAVEACRGCARGLSQVPSSGHERRTRVDLVFQVQELHVDAQIKTCPHCHTETRGRFPPDMPGRLQYGPGLVAQGLHLMVTQMVSLKRTAQTLQALSGRRISEATLLAWVRRTHGALADWERQAKKHLLAPPVLHADETGMRVQGKNQWLHSYSSGKLTLKFCHPRRGREAIEAVGLVPQYRGVLVHDRWASYLGYENCRHALCGAHLLRDLQFVVDSNDYAWARQMKQLLVETVEQVRNAKRKVLTQTRYQALQRRYRDLLLQGRKEIPQSPPRRKGQRGRVAKSEAENLLEALEKHEAAVLRFAGEPAVHFTNNLAERNLRMAKVKQKVSGCFRTHPYAVAWCRISSYLQSMSYQGYNPLTAVQIALKGQAARMLEAD